MKHSQGKIYNSCFGIWSNSVVSGYVLKFFASTSFGTCTSQSVKRNVSFSSNVPESKISRNSAPSGFVPLAWMECGFPAGKYHKSPSFWIDLSGSGERMGRGQTHDVGDIHDSFVLSTWGQCADTQGTLENVCPLTPFSLFVHSSSSENADLVHYMPVHLSIYMHLSNAQNFTS